MFSYLKSLIDKSNPASTSAFLTIFCTIVLTAVFVGVVISDSLGHPIGGVVIPVLSSLVTLTGVQSLNELKDKFKVLKDKEDDPS